MQMKYIVVSATNRDLDQDYELILLFPCVITHKNFFETVYRMGRQRHGMRIDVEDVVSAGFVRFGSAGLECYGESESLNKKSRPIDTAILQNQSEYAQSSQVKYHERFLR